MKQIALYFLVFVFAFAKAQAASMPETMAAVKKASPLPGLMMVIKIHGDKLNLSEEQKQSLAVWAKAHHPIVTKLALAVKRGEKSLYKAALAGMSKEDMMVKLEALLEKRRTISVIKMDCRDNMRQILNDEQWNKVIELYQGK